MSPARDLDERFADWVDGRLSAADRDRLATELTADPVLQSAAEDYRATVELLRRSLAGDESAPEDLVDTIVAATDGLDGLPGGAVRRRHYSIRYLDFRVLSYLQGITKQMLINFGEFSEEVPNHQ